MHHKNSMISRALAAILLVTAHAWALAQAPSSAMVANEDIQTIQTKRAPTANIQDSDALQQKLLTTLQQKYPATRFTAVKKSQIEGLYLVQMNRQVAYTDSKGQFFMFGHLFDMSSRTDLTQSYIDQLEPERVDISSLKPEDAIVFGNGTKKLIVFSDPECPFCKQLEKELAQLADVQILLYPFPIAQIHPNASSVAKHIWCSKDRAKAWRQYLAQGTLDALPSQEANCATPIERNVAVAAQLGINGTPTLIAADGRILSGTRSSSEIQKWLNKQ